jgi:hypothetical protein
VRVLVKGGRARFRSLVQGGGGRHFEVVMGERGYQWHEFNPQAWVVGLDTDFLVSAGEPIEVGSLEGRVLVSQPELADATGARVLASGQATSLYQGGTPAEAQLPPERWWEDDFFQTDDLEEPLGGYEPLAGVLCVAGLGALLLVAAMAVVWFVGRRSPRAKWILIVLGILLLLTLGGGCLGGLWFLL